MINGCAILYVSFRLSRPCPFGVLDDANAAVVAGHGEVCVAVCEFEGACEVGESAGGIGVRVIGIVSCEKVKWHHLKESHRTGAGDSTRIPTGFDLHDGGNQVRVKIRRSRPSRDRVSPMLDFHSKYGGNAG